MEYMHSEWKDRLAHWIRTLKNDLYLPLGGIDVEAFLTREHLTPETAVQGSFTPIRTGEMWGMEYEYCWMRGSVTLPPEAQGRRIVMDLPTGGETTLFVDGRSFGTYRAEWVHTPHHYIVDNCLSACGEAGRTYSLLMEAYAGHYYPEATSGGVATGPVLPGSYQDPKAGALRAKLGRLTYGAWNEDAYQLYIDLETLLQLAGEVDPQSLRADRLCAALEQATLVIDFEQPLDARVKTYRAARALLAPLLEAKNGTTAPQFYAVGNAHLDLAWLWPMEETHRKTSRTFAQQLRLLEEYPEYKYLQSQPAAYVMCREHYPELYARILEAIQRRQWIAEGAMWVEPDTNMTSGESLIRQILHGKRFYKEELGVDSVVLWLPDTFGYSAVLPQILKGCGVRYLVTQKIFWSYNEGDRFPYHYFTWQGADGSAIDTFLPTSYTYCTDPKEVCGVWNARVQKRGLEAFLLPFGYGDGGGGPCRDHIEYLRREKDLEGMPRVKIESPTVFFEEMEKRGGPQHTYVGELYFSAHRGVYTSQAAIKRGNRKAEIALREAEMWGAIAMRRGFRYPMDEMDAMWKKLLLNQFHDILPGSSIAPVYERAREDHRRIIAGAHAILHTEMDALCSGNDGLSVLNSLSFARSGVIEAGDAFKNGAVTTDGTPVPVCHADGKTWLKVTVPPCGAVTVVPGGEAVSAPAATARLTEDGARLENEHVRVTLNQRGEVISWIDKATGREFAAAPMNRLRMYKDVPRLFDAWDIDSNYALQPVDIDEPATLTVGQPGGLRAAIHMERRVAHSWLKQDIVLDSGSRRLDFVTQVDWNELHRLLKVEFPVTVQAAEGINEIQFGYIKRPTHRSRLYDSDRFEVCNQRYSALCDNSHGAAVLNDCKYGISMNGNALQLTLLRAAAAPEMRADNGLHAFTYAFTAWEGSFMDSPVVREAYDLNVPLQTAAGACEPFSAFSVDRPNVFIDTVKPAEDGSGDIILRLYEAKRADTDCGLAINLPASRVQLCDMLENPVGELPLEAGRVGLHFGTFEIKTLRVSR